MRRQEPRIKSSYEDENMELRPAYSLKQLEEKANAKHTPELLSKHKTIGSQASEKFRGLPVQSQTSISLQLCEY